LDQTFDPKSQQSTSDKIDKKKKLEKERSTMLSKLRHQIENEQSEKERVWTENKDLRGQVNT